MHGCPKCQQAEELERRARLVAQELADVQEAERFHLTPEEREQIEAEGSLLDLLLERIETQRYSLVES